MRAAGDAPPRLSAVTDLRDLPEILAALRTGPIRLHGLGRSMFPLIRPGDSVEIEAPGALRVGSVYLAELPDGRFVVHRLVRLEHGLAVLRGDFNGRTDPAVPESALRGRVVRVWRGQRPLSMDALLAKAYGRVQVDLTPWVGPARRAARKVAHAALDLATGPMLPVTRGLARSGAVERVGLDALERLLVSLSAAGQSIDPARVRRLEAALGDGSATLLEIAGAAGGVAAIAEVAPWAVDGVDHPGARIDGMWVARLYRQRGLEREILRAAVSWAQSRGLTELWLIARVEDRHARLLYEQEGFQRGEFSSFVESRVARSGVVALRRTL